MTPSYSIDDFKRAARRIGPYVHKTALVSLGEGLLAKAEHEQETGSFKLRGALNKVLGLESEPGREVVCASAGNHGLGVAFACRLVRFDCTVVVPAQAASVKEEAIRRQGAEIVVAPGDYGTAEALGMKLARERGAVWISPYNDREVILGQGTIGLELADQLAERCTKPFELFIPASGGGLLCGVGLALKQLYPVARVIGVQTKAAPYLFTHFHGKSMDAVKEEPTIADGLAGPVDTQSITLSLLPDACDDMQLVSEDELVSAIKWLASRGLFVEPSAAASMAAVLRSGTEALKVALLTGRNVEAEVMEGILGDAQNE